MNAHLTIELPERQLAEDLRRELQPFDVDVLAIDGHWELRIHLFEQNPEGRVTRALHAIDGWLPSSGVDSVRVHLDGSTYTLHAPPVPAASWAR